MTSQALRSPKHEQPGLQGIIELHRDFIGAAQMNPNSWLLHRDQVTLYPLGGSEVMIVEVVVEVVVVSSCDSSNSSITSSFAGGSSCSSISSWGGSSSGDTCSSRSS